MKKLFFVCALLLTSGTLIADELRCSISQGMIEVFAADVSVSTGEKVVYGRLDGYTFSVKGLSKSRYELEIFEPLTPSRSYSAASLYTKIDSLSWTYWSREVLIETSCRLK